MSSRINKQSVVNKFYCKVCHDAGKPESEYTSHYVRSAPDRNGKTIITCPLLQITECRYCHKSGHTTKFCPVIAKYKKDEEKIARQAKYKEEEENKKKKTKNQSKKETGFAAIYIDSDTEEDVNNEVKVNNKVDTTNIDIEFPALCGTKVNKPVKTGYAAAIASRPADKVEEKTEVKTLRIKLPEINDKPVPQIKRESLAKKSWAEWSDSDTEDEDEDEDYEEFPSFLEKKPQFYEDYN